MKYLPIVLLGLSGVLGLIAWGVWFVSDAHGHGLAAGDRTTITILLAASAAALVGAIALLASRAN